MNTTAKGIYRITPAIRAVAEDVLDLQGTEAHTIWRLMTTSLDIIPITPEQAAEVIKELDYRAESYIDLAPATRAAYRRQAKLLSAFLA